MSNKFLTLPKVLMSDFSVPSMVSDLTEIAEAGKFLLESLMFGGAPAPNSLAARARKAFPTTSMCVYFVLLLK